MEYAAAVIRQFSVKSVSMPDLAEATAQLLTPADAEPQTKNEAASPTSQVSKRARTPRSKPYQKCICLYETL